MLFSSLTFLYYFLPVAVGLYFLVPKRARNGVLLLCSLVFYAWGEPKYVLLMGVTILLGYGFGLLVGKHREGKCGKAFCILSVAASLSFLLYFKYADFILGSIHDATGWDIPLLGVTLPIGISFYTFQMVSYTVDVYRGEEAQKSLVGLAAYIAMFPQLVAGPIVRYSSIAKQLGDRRHSWGLAAYGIRRFVIGLAKKALLANQLGEACSQLQAMGGASVLSYWLDAAAFTLQIYFDFSGYSDMAIGLGSLFGFRFQENFRYPYVAASITEFWRRWHISLGSWFRDYVYIPLGGNRKGWKRQVLNILAVWVLTGFWHGASWNFLAWGLFFAVLLIAEKLWLLKRLQKSKVLSHAYTMFSVMLGFLLFQAGSLGQALDGIGGLFGAGGIPLASEEALYCLRSYAVVLLAGGIGATPIVRDVARRVKADPAEPLFVAVLLLTVTAYLVDGSFNPFLYFRF